MAWQIIGLNCGVDANASNFTHITWLPVGLPPSAFVTETSELDQACTYDSRFLSSDFFTCVQNMSEIYERILTTFSKGMTKHDSGPIGQILVVIYIFFLDHETSTKQIRR